MHFFSNDRVALLRRLLNGEVAFMAVAEPGSNNITLFTEGEITEGVFTAGDAPSVVISLFDGRTAGLDRQTSRAFDADRMYPSTSRADHAAAVAAISSRLAAEGEGKTVLSRVISGITSVDPLEAAGRYLAEFPATWRFIYYTPATGLWFGASPELLFENDSREGRSHTMALAGTRPLGTPGPWDDKNIEEHELVVRFIVDALRQCALRPSVGKRSTVAFGSVEHLMTPVEAAEAFDPLMAIAMLSPTPALAGYPRPTALAEIRSLESHRRGCYGGCVVYDTADGRTVAFVNLRSVHFHGNGNSGEFNIFVGGGITSKSCPDDEWRETELKSETLLRILNNTTDDVATKQQ